MVIKKNAIDLLVLTGKESSRLHPSAWLALENNSPLINSVNQYHYALLSEQNILQNNIMYIFVFVYISYLHIHITNMYNKIYSQYISYIGMCMYIHIYVHTHIYECGTSDT